MNTPKSIEKDVLGFYQKRINTALDSFLQQQRPYAMYNMMRYFLGFTDERLQKLTTPVGKRFRSALSLLLADAYGGGDRALPVALSIELFHNFTLIHDDIFDRDTLRRGRPTVWKIWGDNHAINTGDAQLLLAIEKMNEFVRAYPEAGSKVEKILRSRYLEVIEGQYLDFSLTEASLKDPSVTEEAFLAMIEKKTAVLVGAATAGGGIAGGAPVTDEEALWNYGISLGMTVQLHNDHASIWGNGAITGKDLYGDIREKKKTLPIIWTHTSLSQKDAKLMEALYAVPAPLSEATVLEIIGMLESVNAKEHSLAKIQLYSETSLSALEKLSIGQRDKKKLVAINTQLLSHA